jgi:cytochrome c556
VEVEFPAELREHTLANMRDHLFALQEIQAALAAGKFDQAAEVSERRLGMSSLASHGAHDVAKYMPQGMQDAGSGMHRSASRFALAAQDAAAANDVKPALAALAEVTATCVACHAAYRLK